MEVSGQVQAPTGLPIGKGPTVYELEAKCTLIK